MCVEQGEIVALLGSNGAGKSTMLRTISGLIRPLSGTLRFRDRSIAGLSPEAIAKLGVAHVPERRPCSRASPLERTFSLAVRIVYGHRVAS